MKLIDTNKIEVQGVARQNPGGYKGQPGGCGSKFIGSETCVSLNSSMESNKEEEKDANAGEIRGVVK